jgi:hypothetical protein
MTTPLLNTCSTPAGLRLAALKERLLAERAPARVAPWIERLLRLAANEAEALAWQTSVPLLVFPALLDEKLEAAMAYVGRQHSVLSASRPEPAPAREKAAGRAPAAVLQPAVRGAPEPACAASG